MANSNIYIMLILLGFCSCLKRHNLPEASNFTLTYVDTTVVFGRYSTFIITDTVIVVPGERYNPDSAELRVISSVIPLVTGELLQRGYQQVDTISKADIIVNAILFDAPPSSADDMIGWLSQQQIDKYLEWYSGGNPIWGDFTGFWYPWTYDDVETQPGILAIELVDGASVRKLAELKSVKPQTAEEYHIKFLWQAIISGILKDGIYDAKKGAQHIDEAFNQSEYLQK